MRTPGNTNTSSPDNDGDDVTLETIRSFVAEKLAGFIGHTGYVDYRARVISLLAQYGTTHIGGLSPVNYKDFYEKLIKL